MPRSAASSRLVEAQGPQPFGARAFEILQVVGVVNDAAGIRILVVDANGQRKTASDIGVHGFHGATFYRSVGVSRMS